MGGSPRGMSMNEHANAPLFDKTWDTLKAAWDAPLFAETLAAVEGLTPLGSVSLTGLILKNKWARVAAFETFVALSKGTLKQTYDALIPSAYGEPKLVSATPQVSSLGPPVGGNGVCIGSNCYGSVGNRNGGSDITGLSSNVSGKQNLQPNGSGIRIDCALLRTCGGNANVAGRSLSPPPPAAVANIQSGGPGTAPGGIPKVLGADGKLYDLNKCFGPCVGAQRAVNPPTPSPGNNAAPKVPTPNAHLAPAAPNVHAPNVKAAAVIVPAPQVRTPAVVIRVPTPAVHVPTVQIRIPGR